MEAFPNYLVVEFDGREYKVAPLRLNDKTNRATLKAVGTAGVLANIDDVMRSLETSLLENHDKKDVEDLLSKLRYSGKKDAPFTRLVLAMAGVAPSDDTPAGNDE